MRKYKYKGVPRSQRRVAVGSARDYEDFLEQFTAAAEKMEDAFREAKTALRNAVGVNDIIYRRAEGYWIAAIEQALSGNWHGATVHNTLDELEERLYEVEDEIY
jgi:predicted RNase H-like HicB family nuclease